MKKLLAMVLALVMTLSLAVSASAVKADEKINEDYAEAVAVLNGMGVFKGYEDGSFKPENKITRAEVATIIYRIYTKDLAKNDKSGLYASYNKFSDMAGAGWAAGYIGYCANAEFVKGYPDGTFNPSGNVTGYEVLTMILRAIGYDKNGEFTGADWALNVAKYAEQAGVLKNVKGVDLNAPATRELVAELLFRAIAKAPMVTYTAAFGYQTVSFSGSKNDSKLFKDNETLGHKKFDLTPNAINGTYGRPATKWTYNVGNEKTTVYDKPVATYTEKVAPCDVCKDLSEKKEATFVEQWIDGVKVVDSAKKAVSETYKATDTSKKIGAQGQLTEVYANGDDYTVVYINTYLAKVTKVIEEVKDKNDHVKVEASVNVDVYGLKDKTTKDSFETTGFKKDDMVLVTYNNGDIASMEAAKGEVAKLTSVKGAKKVGNTTSDMSDILGVAYADATVAFKATVNPLEGSTVALGSSYTFYYDTYGNIIGVDDYTRDANYVVIDRIWADHDNGKVSYHADLVNAADATVISNVVLDSIEGYNSLKFISTDEKSEFNAALYHDLMVYTVNDDGEYELYRTGIDVVDNDGDHYPCIYDAKVDDDRIVTGSDDGDVYLNKDTVILFQYTDSPNGTYKSYTLENLPEKFYGYVEYVVGSDGKADVVYIHGVDMTYSYVFIPDVNDVTTSVNKDKTVTMTLNGAKVLKDDGTFETKNLQIVGKSKNMVVEDLNDLSNLTELKAAGLYQLFSFGDDNSLLLYTGVEQVQSVKEFSGKDVTGIYVAGSWVEFDESKATYTYWTGDYEGTYHNDPYSELLTDKTDANSELKAGDWVFVQYDEDGKKVKAIYEVDFEVSVDFDADSKTLDKDAKIDAPTMYYGKELKDFTVAVSKWVKLDSVKNNTAADYTVVAPVDANKDPLTNDVARTFTAKAKANETVKGNITVSLADDSNTAIGKLASVTLDGEKVQTATGYTTLAQALENATTMNPAAVNPQYKLVVNTKLAKDNQTLTYGSVKWASDKEAASDLEFDTPANFSGTAITLTGANKGTYVVIQLEHFGDVAYYAYRIAD